MIRFIKEVYLTGFVIIFRISRPKDFYYKAGSAIAFLTLVEWLILVGTFGYVEMFLGKKILLSKPVVIIAFFALSFANGCILFTHDCGAKFEREFDNLKKSRRIVLVVSCAVVVVAVIVFFIFSAITYRRFIGAH